MKMMRPNLRGRERAATNPLMLNVAFPSLVVREQDDAFFGTHHPSRVPDSGTSDTIAKE